MKKYVMVCFLFVSSSYAMMQVQHVDGKWVVTVTTREEQEIQKNKQLVLEKQQLTKHIARLQKQNKLLRTLTTNYCGRDYLLQAMNQLDELQTSVERLSPEDQEAFQQLNLSIFTAALLLEHEKKLHHRNEQKLQASLQAAKQEIEMLKVQQKNGNDNA